MMAKSLDRELLWKYTINLIKMNVRLTYLLFGILLLLWTIEDLPAQPRQSRVQVIVTPVDVDWTYDTGERADFRVQILRDGQPVPDAKIRYTIGPEQMPPKKEGEQMLNDGVTSLEGMTLDNPGFVRCEVTAEVEGHTYRSWGTAGFEPAAIEPVVEMPDDFDAFWADAKAGLAEIPMDAKLTLLPEYCTPKINVYHLRLTTLTQQNWRGNTSHFYGILSVPKAPGQYPAILNVPGAGARPYSADTRAEEGFITLNVGIHGIPVNLDPGVYDDLMKGAIFNYWTKGLHDKDQYYYKRVYLGCVRAVDFLFSMPEFDGENLAVTGGSQGGALSIVIAGLDERVKYLAAFFPALCDLTGYLEGRAGGWPHMFKEYDDDENPAWTEVAPYFDVVNFARRVQAPGWYSWGYNDNVCPPTSMYAAYNVIEAPKELHPFLETGHWTFPEQREKATQWLRKKLKE
jgi:cephalosporin-C deacetylase